MMWLVRASLRRPFAIFVIAIAIAFASAFSLRRAPADIFPSVGVPVIYVVQPYGGLSPTQMEGQIVGYYEYHFLYINGIEHIESESVQGMGMVKLYFHPGTDIAQSLAQVTAMAFRATSFMPSGTLPPFIVRFDVGSVPVGQLVFSSDQRSEAEIQDAALFKVRPLLATLPGVSAPPPSGGKVRMVVAYVDPDRLRAFGLSADQVATSIARANLTLPSGNVRIGDYTTIASTNAMVESPKDLELVPLTSGPGTPVLVRDVARIEDGSDVVSNVALVNGRRTVYMPLNKTSSASTLDVVRSIKEALPKMQAQLPEDVKVTFEFDQSVYVTNAVRSLVSEALLGACLTALTVLAFLRSWRSALIVVVTIPLSILAALGGLRIVGQTINVMTLSGLALAVGILVDEATVAIENIDAHLHRGKRVGRAVVDAMSEVMRPRVLAMLCVLVVFAPTFFLAGIGRALFPPLALAVGFSMIASFVISSTLVPVLAARLLGKTKASAPRSSSWSVRIVEAYAAIVTRLVRRRKVALLAYVVLCAPVFLLVGRLGTELFPAVDTGQFQLRIRAPAGTRLERTEEIVRGVDATVREEVGDPGVRMTLANIGAPAWTYPVNALYVFNAGPQEAVLLVALDPALPRPPMPLLQEQLRQKLASKYPTVQFSFEAGDIVSQVLNFGSTTPIHLSVSGKNVQDTRAFAARVMTGLQRVDSLRDVQIPQPLDYPTVEVAIDRERGGRFGLTVDRIGRSLVATTSSSVLTTPIFWTDPKTGVGYRVQVRVPESSVQSIEDLLTTPVVQDGSAPVLLRDVATVRTGKTPGEVDHYNSQRTINVDANLHGSDLGGAADAVDRAVAAAGEPPKGVTVTLHGQAEQMRATLSSLREGVALAIVAIVLLLALNFQSLREPVVVLTTMPAVLGGVVVVLSVTGTSLNVQSSMGAIMAIGVSVANAVLLLSFARGRWESGDDLATAAVAAARSRLRPIAMTSVAMILGMVPTALALGEGGEQSAPLGRAVIGGLAASTVATLFLLPSLFVLFGPKGKPRSASLDPDDENAVHDAAVRA